MPEKKRKWKLFDSQREGKGVNKEDLEKTPGLKKFWRIYRENFFGRLLVVNIIMVVCNAPLILALLALQGLGSASYHVPSGNLFPLLFGTEIGNFFQSGTAGKRLRADGLQALRQGDFGKAIKPRKRRFANRHAAANRSF